jgi:hypothetical protein
MDSTNLGESQPSFHVLQESLSTRRSPKTSSEKYYYSSTEGLLSKLVQDLLEVRYYYFNVLQYFKEVEYIVLESSNNY